MLHNKNKTFTFTQLKKSKIMNLDDYIEGTFNPNNPANREDENDIDEIEVEDPEILETN